MKTIKTFTLVSFLIAGITTSAFASWWNPFTWSLFTKKHNQKIETTVNADDIKKQNNASVNKKENMVTASNKTEKKGLFTLPSTNELIFTESEKLFKHNYSNYSCGYYDKKPNCNDIISYDSYKGNKIEVEGVEYKYIGGETQKTTQVLSVDISTFTFAENIEMEVKKIIETAGMSKTTLKSVSNYEEMINGDGSKITPDNPIKFTYFIGHDNKNKYYLVVTRYSVGGDVMGGVGNIYLEKK